MSGQPLKYIRHQLIVAAKELHYPKEIITRLENAKNEAEMTRIMTYARCNL